MEKFRAQTIRAVLGDFPDSFTAHFAVDFGARFKSRCSRRARANRLLAARGIFQWAPPGQRSPGSLGTGPLARG